MYAGPLLLIPLGAVILIFGRIWQNDIKKFDVSNLAEWGDWL